MSAILIDDCPRCGAQHVTFNVHGDLLLEVEQGWRTRHEAFCECRRCHRATIFIVSLKNYELRSEMDKTGAISARVMTVNNHFEIEGYISYKDKITVQPPEHIPGDIQTSFREGASCLAVQCWNAAATMFRVCLDVATRNLLPLEDPPGMNRRVRYDLGLRLPWLFDNGKLPADLKSLATCIHQDGNDGAHRANLQREDAEDLLDFTTALLTRLYTEPERVRQMEGRRAQRRARSVKKRRLVLEGSHGRSPLLGLPIASTPVSPSCPR